MDTQHKERLLAEAKSHVQRVRDKIKGKIVEVSENILNIRSKLSKLSPQDQVVQARILQNQTKQETELGALYPSPYFIKCEIMFEGSNDHRIFYFSKFAYPEEGIYSWTSPAAVLRFEQPGKFNYAIPELGNKAGMLVSKDQYMISNGTIVYMATEGIDAPRTLIYQEYFSQRKTGFVLREIVEQMEKAQDKVIRAPIQGSFLITGPAGSGKTTLALHRIAYLLQSPDTAARFTNTQSVVFVQDSGTKTYFGKLLPELGVSNVRIVTFFEWARELLGLDSMQYVYRYGNNALEKDTYEFAKNNGLRSMKELPMHGSVYGMLNAVYADYFDDSQKLLFEQQQRSKVLDRFDVTILLILHERYYGGLKTYETSYEQLKGGKVKRTKTPIPLRYSLVILDEAQNFLPEQIRLIRGCADQNNYSVMYVGDIHQQTQLCTIRNWDDVGEYFTEENTALLHKNYRSTKQIMEYIRQRGYAVEVPENLREGKEVVEQDLDNGDLISTIQKIITEHATDVIGVLSVESNFVTQMKKVLGGSDKLHILGVHEAQGVEFDVVIYIRPSAEYVQLGHAELDNERHKVYSDLEYVALTRAMNNLYVLRVN